MACRCAMACSRWKRTPTRKRAPAAAMATRARRRRWSRSKWPACTPGSARGKWHEPAQRSRARRRALQAVYAWQMAGGTAQQVIAQFAHEQAHEIADLEYFDDLVRGVLRLAPSLDEALSGFIDRDMAQVDQVERAALRIAAYELLHRPDVPYRVVINEAIDSKIGRAH